MTMMFTPDDYRILAGEGFNALLARDAELKRLEGLKYDKTLEARVLMEVLGIGDFRVGKLPVRPLSAAKWAFLWLLESPFVIGGNIDPADLDLILYVLSVWDIREIAVAPHEIPAAASDYRFAPGISMEEVRTEVRQIIHTAFLPLEMLPPSSSGASAEPDRLDGIWATHIAGLAARESGMSFNYCLHRMSLSSVCGFFVNFRRREGADADQIRRRPNQEIQSLISARVNALAAEYLSKKE